MRRPGSVSVELARLMESGGVELDCAELAVMHRGCEVGSDAKPGKACARSMAAWSVRLLGHLCCCCLVTVVVCLGFALYFVERSVGTAHMSFRQRMGDAYWVGLGCARQRLARGGSRSRLSLKDKRASARHLNVTQARTVCAPQRPHLVMHLKVPKAASTTIFDLLNELAPRNGFVVNSRPMYLDERHVAHSAAQYASYFSSFQRRTVRTAHGAYLDFGQLGDFPRPAYVALMREPKKRLASHYNYIHWGPRSRWATFWKGQDRDAESFETCAARHLADARAAGEWGGGAVRARRLGELAGAKGDCLYWANVQLAYFCGVKNECAPQSLRDDAHGRNALRVASANIQRDFVAVGLVEDLKRSLKLFETVLPRYFDGMLAAYGKAALWSRQTQVTDTAAAPDRPAPHAPRNTSAPAETDSAAASRRDKRRDLDEFLDNKVLRWEQALYERVKQDMDKQLAACNILR